MVVAPPGLPPVPQFEPVVLIVPLASNCAQPVVWLAIFRPWDWMTRPVKVEVAKVPLPPTATMLPLTESVPPGEVDPMPTLPFESMRNAVDVVLPVVVVEMRSSGQPLAVDEATIESKAWGVEVAPMPTRPLELTWKMVLEALVASSKSLEAVVVP